MHVTASISDIRAIRHRDPKLTWGLVPTMGALHEGHLSLVRLARQQNDRVAVSIFINPAQFNNPDDLIHYPRTLEDDLNLLARAGVDLVWTPTEDDVYPPDFQTSVIVSEVTQFLEGAHRPGHFEGVATIVAKLFNIFEPSLAYFGQKDAQQVVVIKQMVRDLNFNLDIVVCPIIRESDGLAMSSRNAHLSPQERQAAVILYRALTAAQETWQTGQRDAHRLRQLMVEIVNSEPLARIDYISVADPDTLQEIEGVAKQGLLSMAVYIGDTRLIDNIVVRE